MRKEIFGQTFDEERALYNLTGADVIDCTFAGPADGESALKEARDVKLENCSFSLRYPLWHVEGFKLHDSSLDELTRAPIWYSRDGLITDSDLNCIKAVRECRNIKISDCTISSEEFGWKCEGITISDSTLKAQYLQGRREPAQLPRPSGHRRRHGSPARLLHAPHQKGIQASSEVVG